jgi:hypothetical protein
MAGAAVCSESGSFDAPVDETGAPKAKRLLEALTEGAASGWPLTAGLSFEAFSRR